MTRNDDVPGSGPVWIHRRALDVPAIYAWGIEAGVRKMFPPEEMHFTQATVRSAGAWGDLRLDGNELVIPAGPKPVQIFAFTIKAVAFDHPRIRERQAFLLERFPDMDHGTSMRPHLSLYKGGRMPRITFDGEIVLGPEIAMPFDAGNVLGIKHVRIADHVQ